MSAKDDPFKYGLGAFDTGAAKFPYIINTSGVDEDYGTDGGEFTGFFHGSVVVPGTSETMEMCWCVNALASEPFTGIASTEETDMDA